MPAEVVSGPTKRTAILYRNDDDGVIAAGATVATKVRADGLARVEGFFHSDQPPASGFPRVRQSVDGTNWSIVDQVARDLSQADYQYRFDFKLRAPYVQVQWTHGATQGTFLRASCSVRPGASGDPDDDVGSVSGQLQSLRSDKDTDFNGAITANEHATANLTGLNGNAGVIEGVTLLSDQDITWQVHFWSSDQFDDADLDDDSWLGAVELNGANAVNIGNAESGTYRHVRAPIAIPYEDADGSNELHVSLVPVDVDKSGDVVLIVHFRPE